MAVPVPFGTSFVQRTLFHDAVRAANLAVIFDDEEAGVRYHPAALPGVVVNRRRACRRPVQREHFDFGRTVDERARVLAGGIDRDVARHIRVADPGLGE